MATRELQETQNISDRQTMPVQGLVSNEDFSAHRQTERAQAPTKAEPTHIEFTNPYQSAAGDCQLKQFVPNPNSKGAKEWFDQAREQATKSVAADDQGLYTVARGDSLSGIAERIIKQRHQNPSHKAIADEVNELIKLNPELACNQDLMRTGQKLKLNSTEQAQTAVDKPQTLPASQPVDNSSEAQNFSPSQKETGRWQNILQKYDADGSGTINFEEAVQSLKTGDNSSPSAEQAKSFKTNFDEGDLNHNGELELNEFVHEIRKPASGQRANI